MAENYYQPLSDLLKTLYVPNASPPSYWEQAVDLKTIWRFSWALYTLADLIDVISTLEITLPGIDSDYFSNLLDFSLQNGLDSGKSTDWWDDFGWLGLACLRVAELGTDSAVSKKKLFQQAANAWAYMHGNGWQKSGGKGVPFTVPYPKLFRKAADNIGGLNVYQNAVQHSGLPTKTLASFQPRFTPGGIWNFTITAGATPNVQKSMNTDRVTPYLSPLQNTVTNNVFTLLSLRLYKALTNPNNQQYFTNANFNVDSVRVTFINQMQWYQKWILQNPNQSLFLPLPTGTLIRERPSTYASGKWDAGYDPYLAWTGDQGLFLAILTEGMSMLSSDSTSDWCDLISIRASLLQGLNVLFSPIPDVSQSSSKHLRPWVEYVNSNATFNTFPEQDDADYQTGLATLYRTLLQLDPSELKTFGLYDLIVNAADDISKPSFPAPSALSYLTCDGLFYRDSLFSGYDDITPYINRMALLTLAIKLKHN